MHHFNNYRHSIHQILRLKHRWNKLTLDGHEATLIANGTHLGQTEDQD